MVTQAEIDAVEWTHSKRGSPHEYIVHHNHPTLCIAILKDIAKHGIYEMWQSQRYRYFYFNGFKYWHIGQVINRVPVEKPTTPLM